MFQWSLTCTQQEASAGAFTAAQLSRVWLKYEHQSLKMVRFVGFFFLLFYSRNEMLI